MVLSIGLSMIAGRMLAKKSDSPIEPGPTTLSKRGSFMAWVLGRRKVGPVFAWAGAREYVSEKQGGKGLLGGPDGEVAYEAGWHIICVGPVERLLGIIQAGKSMFRGPLTRASHPSGSVVDLGKEGSFAIYWGEVDQPLNAQLAAHIGVNSRWPNACYIYWIRKRLGPSPTWPALQYVVERRPTLSLLTRSTPWTLSQYTPDPAEDHVNIRYLVADADEDVGFLEIGDNTERLVRPAYDVEILDVPGLAGVRKILRVDIVQIPTGGVSWAGIPLYTTHYRVHLVGGTAGAVLDLGNSRLRLYRSDGNAGGNIAHMVAELLFAPFPFGLGKNPLGFEGWDVESLEQWGEEAEAQDWRSSVLAEQGETAEAVLGNCLQDHGVMLPLDNRTGDLTFRRVREPVGLLPHLGPDIYSGKFPEIETSHGEPPVDRLVFSFSDKSHRYEDMTITVDDDGRASREDVVRARRVGIFTTVQFATAASLSELRAPEELADGAEFRLEASRAARNLMPGDAITAEGFDAKLLVTSVEVDPDSERVEIDVLPNMFGGIRSDFETNPGISPGDAISPAVDPQAAWVEIPEQLLGTFPQSQQIAVLNIRAHSQIVIASTHLSLDNLTYTIRATDRDFVAGGELIAELPETTLAYLVEGPEYTEQGPDNGTLTQDLSADDINYGAAKQLCVIVSTAGAEICILRKATITGADTRRLDGLSRGRFGTRTLTHPAGAAVFIFDITSLSGLSDVALQPDRDLYLKTQPSTEGQAVLLSEVSPYGSRLYGVGVRPLPPQAVHLTAPHAGSAGRSAGDDVTVSWLLTTGSLTTGLGGQIYGSLVADPTIPGTVLVELLAGTTVVATKTVPAETASMVWTDAELALAPSQFQFRVTHIANGLASEPSDILSVTAY